MHVYMQLMFILSFTPHTGHIIFLLCILACIVSRLQFFKPLLHDSDVPDSLVLHHYSFVVSKACLANAGQSMISYNALAEMLLA